MCVLTVSNHSLTSLMCRGTERMTGVPCHEPWQYNSRCVSSSGQSIANRSGVGGYSAHISVPLTTCSTVIYVSEWELLQSVK
jgi:hypothetical protein